MGRNAIRYVIDLFCGFASSELDVVSLAEKAIERHGRPYVKAVGLRRGGSRFLVALLCLRRFAHLQVVGCHGVAKFKATLFRQAPLATRVVPWEIRDRAPRAH